MPAATPSQSQARRVNGGDEDAVSFGQSLWEEFSVKGDGGGRGSSKGPSVHDVSQRFNERRGVVSRDGTTPLSNRRVSITASGGRIMGKGTDNVRKTSSSVALQRSRSSLSRHYSKSPAASAWIDDG
eukprot:jgi/Bigna1/126910/aug1.3_g1618